MLLITNLNTVTNNVFTIIWTSFLIIDPLSNHSCLELKLQISLLVPKGHAPSEFVQDHLYCCYLMIQTANCSRNSCNSLLNSTLLQMIITMLLFFWAATLITEYKSWSSWHTQIYSPAAILDKPKNLMLKSPDAQKLQHYFLSILATNFFCKLDNYWNFSLSGIVLNMILVCCLDSSHWHWYSYLWKHFYH